MHHNCIQGIEKIWIETWKQWIWKNTRKLLQMLGTNLIDWKKSATAKNRTQSFGLTQWFEKIGCDGSQNFEMHKKSFGKIQKTKIENSEIWKFGKTGNEFGKSEIRKRIRKLNGFWKNVRKIWFNCPSLECLETINL